MKKLFLKGLMTVTLCLFFAQGAWAQTPTVIVDIIVNAEPSCHGALGELSLNITGGTAPYTYKWYGTDADPVTTPTLSNVKTQGYYVYVTDNLGNVGYDSISFSYDRLYPSTTAAHCPASDGTATLNYYGNHSFNVIWSNGATSQTATGLAPGEVITVQASDDNGCPFTFIEYINEQPIERTSTTVEIGSVPSFTMDHEYLPATCTRPDGYVTIDVTGTTAPYSYVWNTSPVATGISQSNLTTGYYNVRVTDNAGCIGDYSFYLPNTPGSLYGSAYTTQNEYCLRQDGKVSAYYNGGTAPFSIKWSTGETGVLDVSNLSAGYYYVTIKDAENCEITKGTLVNRSSPMSSSVSVTSADCNNENGAINASVTGGTLPYTYQWSNGATSQNISALGIGWYYLVATDAEGCVTPEYTILNTEDNCQGNIKGVIYQDNNNNCVKDAGEPVIFDQSINASNTVTQYGMCGASDAGGNYLLRYPYNGTYKINTYSSSPYYHTQCPINGQTQTVVAPNDYTYNIGMVPIAVGPDLQTSIYSSVVRPGFIYYYDVFVRNVGTEASSSGTLEIQLGDIEELMGFNGFPASYDPALNLITFDANNINVNEVRHYSFSCRVPPTTLLNKHFNVTAVANPLSGDLNELTNTYTLKQTVVGSYDPNDIQSFKTGDLSLGEDTTLTYHIRFQNTGTFYAEFVVVRDTLDPKLDPATLRDVQSSHPVSVTFLKDNIVEFRFDNIFLQDSTTNEAASHGFVNYKIDLKENIVAGDIVPNSAAIYFDYNAPVLTNKVNNRVANPTGIVNGTDTKRTALVFPNPAHDQASFRFPETMRSFELLNAVGSVVYSTQPDQNTVEVNFTGWKGMHYYRATNAKGEMYSGKIVIE